MYITCKRCGIEKPDSEYYPSSLKRGESYCKKCCNEWSKKAQKKYREKRKLNRVHIDKPKGLNKREKALFESTMGGYIITLLNYAKANETKFAIYSTKTDTVTYVDSDEDIRQLFYKALKDVTQNGTQED